MAKSSLGKAVSRVGASGGGRTYAKKRPSLYYAVISAIVILGLAAVVYSRYERTHPVVISTAFPVKGSTGYVGFASEACGTVLHLIPTGAITGTDYQIIAPNVVKVSPTTDAESGSNATVGLFISKTPGLVLTNKVMTIPNLVGVKTKPLTYSAGALCPKGTKYAGKMAYPEIGYWTSVSQNRPTITSDPSAVVMKSNMLFTLAFLPKNVAPTIPSNATISLLFSETAGTATTTTTPTTQPTTTTTVPVTTTTKPT